MRMSHTAICLIASVQLLLAEPAIEITTKQLTTTQLQLSWPVQSLVPAGGVQVFAEYQAESSSDLIDWTPASERIVGTPFAGKQMSVQVPMQGPGQFLRVHIILDFTGIDLAGLRANGADFGRATLAGAEMFNCEIRAGRFDGADLLQPARSGL